MRKGIYRAALSALLCIFTQVAAYAEDSTRMLGGAAGWSDFIVREGVTLTDHARQYPALTLSSARLAQSDDVDLFLPFDEGLPASFSDAAGRYRLSASRNVLARGPEGNLAARIGAGAALFSFPVASGPDTGLRLQAASGQAMLSEGRSLGDFSMDFWLYPLNADNGEQILAWKANPTQVSSGETVQRLLCGISANRLEWSFSGFFFSPDRKRAKDVILRSRSRLVPRTWTHHLIRFDAETGLLEYLVDGKTEALAYVSSTDRQGGEVYRPVVGASGELNVGSRFAGLMDEFRLSSSWMDAADLQRYLDGGGRAETELIDLGGTNARLARLSATWSGAAESEVRFFARSADRPYGWTNDPEDAWRPVPTDRDLGDLFRGRWLQLAVILYPSGDGESAPILSDLTLHISTDDAPRPPSYVAAMARDGAVELSWRPSTDPDLGGYMLYYGTRSGNYFGSGSPAGDSPIDLGNRTSVLVDGLRNGTLYYFVICAYDRADPRHIGDFSREVSARPARTE